MKKTGVPKYVLVNQRCANVRAFKVKKRAELRAVIKAVDALRLGCAYVPGWHGHMDEIARHLVEWKAQMSEKQWGR